MRRPKPSTSPAPRSLEPEPAASSTPRLDSVRGATAVLFLLVLLVGVATIVVSPSSPSTSNSPSLPSFRDRHPAVRGFVPPPAAPVDRTPLLAPPAVLPITRPPSDAAAPAAAKSLPDAPEPSTGAGRRLRDGTYDCRNVDAGISFLTYANRGSPDSKFCRGIRSQLENRIPVKLLNWGGRHRGNVQKFGSVMEELNDAEPCKLIVFYDAYDVLFARGPEYIKAQLMAMPDLELVFGAECGCWPQAAYRDGKIICNQKYPKSPTPYRYINTGVWAGRAWAANRFLTRLKDPTGKADDQEVAGNLFWRSGGNANFTLDYHAALFQNFHKGSRECQPQNDIVFDEDGEVYNQRTHTHPFLMHFNGGSKNTLLQLEHGIWYLSKSRKGASRHPPRLALSDIDNHPVTVGKAAGVRDTAGTVTFRDLGCKPAKEYGMHPEHIKKNWEL